MKSAKTANYTQLDHNAKIVENEDVVVLTSAQAYEKYPWCREYFEEVPKEGYFVWVKKSVSEPISTSIVICSQYVTQDSRNLVIIDKGVEAIMNSTCAAQTSSLFGKHIGHSKMIVKEDAKLDYKHVHSWGKEDFVDTTMDLFVGKGAEVIYNQKCHRIAKSFKIVNNNHLGENASINYGVTVLADGGNVEMYDDTYLNGVGSNGLSRVKMIAKKDTEFYAKSQMVGNEAGTGHLDCMGLLLGNDSNIVAIPALVNKDKDASLTHEASVGRISDEVLNYLRSRGLSEDEAIDLVITGILGEEEEIVIDGVVISSKEYM